MDVNEWPVIHDTRASMHFVCRERQDYKEGGGGVKQEARTENAKV
ncbi:MAG: hypothetical protein OQL16_07815 [Gammaproteobacteria bacterium]|nr:hypothetical protein [Gammaproteobacteria bacterium]